MEPAKSVEQSDRERQELYKKLWAENPSLYVVWGIVIGLLIAAVVGGNESVWDVLVSFAPEFVGLLFVTLVLDRRAEYRERERHKQQMIRDTKGGSTEFALRAVNELRHEGWLTDGALQGADLRSANLQGARLRGANLQGADLGGANLQGARLNSSRLKDAHLSFANLQGAHLWGANLQGAHLGFVILHGADLLGANLQGARLNSSVMKGAELVIVNLKDADLEGANLFGANLQGATLKDANLQDATLKDANLQDADFSSSKFNEKTLRPDITFYDPQQGPEQLERFTNPKHPDFWRSDEPESPAYRGNLGTADNE